MFVAEARRLLEGARVTDPASGARQPAVAWLRRPGQDLATVRAEGMLDTEYTKALDEATAKLQRTASGPRQAAAALVQVENTIRYDGYISKQDKLLRHRSHLDNLELPADLRYDELTGLSSEAREKLHKVRPETLGQAGRIAGVRAGDLGVLTIYLKRWRKNGGGEKRS